jgi:hypothetical protein
MVAVMPAFQAPRDGDPCILYEHSGAVGASGAHCVCLKGPHVQSPDGPAQRLRILGQDDWK